MTGTGLKESDLEVMRHFAARVCDQFPRLAKCESEACKPCRARKLLDRVAVDAFKRAEDRP